MYMSAVLIKFRKMPLNPISFSGLCPSVEQVNISEFQESIFRNPS